MASTISITYKLQGNAKDLKALINDADGLKKAFNGAAVQADQLSKKSGLMKSAMSGLMKSVGGLAAGVVSVQALFRAVGNAVGVMKDFEKANSELASVLGKSSKEIEGLTQSAMDLGKTTSFTAAEVTSLQTSLARLGFTENQIVAMQESVLKFAAAVGTDLASAADFSGSALRAFGLKASDSRELLDLMAASCSKSALSFSKLQTSIAVVGPVANSFGLSARDTVSILGVLSNAGFDASSAATALRNILLNLSDANGKLVGGLGHTAKTMPEIIDALQELKDRNIDLSEALDMTDKRSVSAFSALIKGAGDVRELYEALGDCNGALDQMYSTMTDNLEGATNRLKSAWQDLALAFREDVTPALKGIYDWLAKVTLRLSNAVKTGLFRFGAQKTNRELEEYKAQYRGRPEALEADLAKAREGYAKMKEWNSPAYDEAKKLSQRKIWMLEEVQMLQQQEAAAKAADQAVTQLNSDEVTEAGTSGESGSKKKGLAEAIQDYNQSLVRAVELNQALGKSTTDTDARLKAMESGLTSIINKYGTESAVVKELIADYNALLKARRGSGASGIDLTGLGSVSGGAKIMGKKVSAPGLVGTDLKKFNKETAKAMTQGEALQTTIGALGGVFRDLAGAVGESAAAWMEWGSNLLSAIAQALPQLTALFVKQNAAATANTAAAASGGASAVASIPYVGPVLAVAAVASILAALASLPKFANGGVISGPTFGLMGEYAGAQHNPEVIAPLNTLRQYIQPVSGGGEVDFRIRGRDLYGTLKKDRRRSSRS